MLIIGKNVFMSNKTINLNESLYNYLCSVSLTESDAQISLRKDTAQFNSSIMQISPDQGQFMALLIKLINAKRVLELGTYTGYSALTMAQALPEDGELIACDHDHRWRGMAERHWKLANVNHKIQFCHEPALILLDRLLAQPEIKLFDLIFIDADKARYDEYYERALKLLKSRGLILLDNVLWGGRVVDVNDTDVTTESIRSLNLKLKTDSRVTISLVPIGDGLTLALKN